MRDYFHESYKPRYIIHRYTHRTVDIFFDLSGVQSR